MDEIKTPSELKQSWDIRKARLVFRRRKNGSKAVTVTIHYSVPYIKEKLWGREKFDFPEYLDSNELNWKRYRKGGFTSVYDRRDENIYRSRKTHTTTYTNFGQKLERLVREACSIIIKRVESKESELS